MSSSDTVTAGMTDTELHRSSLRRFCDEADPAGVGLVGAIAFGLQRLGSGVHCSFADTADETETPGRTPVVGPARWTPEGWAAPALLQIKVTVDDGSEPREQSLSLSVDVPWLTSDDNTPGGQDDEVTRPAWLTDDYRTGPYADIGVHEGIHWRGARYPVVQHVRAAGTVSYLTWRQGSTRKYAVQLAGVFGRTWRLEYEGRRPDKTGPIVAGIRVIGSGLQPSRDRDWFTFAELLDETDARQRSSLAKRLTDPTKSRGVQDLSDDDVRAIIKRLRALRESDLERSRQQPSPSLPADSALTTPMDPRNWTPTGYGETLARSVASATRRFAASWQRAREQRSTDGRDPDRLTGEELAARPPEGSKRPFRVPLGMLDGLQDGLQTAVRRALLDVALGRGRYVDAVVRDRPINTLGRLEASRQHTFLGPDGLEPLNGRLDLRELPDGWRERLCPVQTPESKKIGFIRQSALAAWPGTSALSGEDGSRLRDVLDEYADVSTAAALIPFLSHDDPTRIAIGAKMLKQAVLLEHAEPPLVRTGAEGLVAETGVVRALDAGYIAMTDRTGHRAPKRFLEINGQRYPYGSDRAGFARQDDGWTLRHAEFEDVEAGEILAHAPDVRLEGVGPTLAYGINACVAFMPYEGWNYEDGIVVSRSFADRMTSRHTHRLTTTYERGYDVLELLKDDAVDAWHEAGTKILEVIDLDGRSTVLSFPERFRVVRNPASETPYDQYSLVRHGEIEVRFEVERRLQVGDKLSTRHGGKGVVTRLLPDAEMPMLRGRPVEVLLNPLGVIRRLNIGTLLELHTGLAAWLGAGSPEAFSDAEPVRARRRLGREGRRELERELADLGVPGGLLELTWPGMEGDEGERLLALAGPLYLIKLDHLAKAKSGARADAPASPVTYQPVRSGGWRADEKLAVPQRLGEMEVWALQASGADRVLDELWNTRGVGRRDQRHRDVLLPAGFRSALAHLAVAGLRIEAVRAGEDGAPRSRDLVLDPRSLHVGERLRVAWCGDDLHGLENIFELSEQDRRYALGDDPVRGDGRTETATRSDDDGGQRVRYALPLPYPVAHPWVASHGGGSLPDLRVLAVPPRAALRESDATRRSRRNTRRTRRSQFERLIETVDNLEKELKRVAETGKTVDSVEIRRWRADIERQVRQLLGTLDERPEHDSIAGRLSGKSGLLRRNVLGASVVRSGRAVLVGDPALGPEEARVPRRTALALGIPDEDDRQAPYDDVVIVNRQPTLHPYNLVALRARRWDEDAIAVHPVLLRAIAGDFDGDTIAVHRPIDEDARVQAWRLRRPAVSLRSGANGASLAKRDLDIALGLERTVDSSLRTRCEALWTNLRPLEGDEAGSAETAENLQHLAACMIEAFHAATGWSPALVDLEVSAENGGGESRAERAICDDRHAALAEGFRAKVLGKPQDIEQLLVARGRATTQNEDLAPTIVEGCYLDGLARDGYFAAARQGVSALAAKKLVTPFAGHLTRTLVHEGYEIVIGEHDCGAGAGHTPLTCIGEVPCVVGYGDDLETGRLVEPGTAVGIRAAMFIGERGTQVALKSIHTRDGRNQVGSDVRELGAIFGMLGTITVPESMAGTVEVGGKPVGRLSKRAVIDWSWSEREDLSLAADLLVKRFEEIFDDDNGGVLVARVHAQVLLRRHLDGLQRAIEENDGSVPKTLVWRDPDGAGTPALMTAVWRGRLDALIEACSSDGDGREPLAARDGRAELSHSLRIGTGRGEPA